MGKIANPTIAQERSTTSMTRKKRIQDSGLLYSKVFQLNGGFSWLRQAASEFALCFVACKDADRGTRICCTGDNIYQLQQLYPQEGMARAAQQ